MARYEVKLSSRSHFDGVKHEASAYAAAVDLNGAGKSSTEVIIYKKEIW